MSCEFSSKCQGYKVKGLCKNCFCDICKSKPPPLTIFLWKSGHSIKLCDKHIELINLKKIDKEEFDKVIFITP